MNKPKAKGYWGGKGKPVFCPACKHRINTPLVSYEDRLLTECEHCDRRWALVPKGKARPSTGRVMWLSLKVLVFGLPRWIIMRFWRAVTFQRRREIRAALVAAAKEKAKGKRSKRK